MIIGQRLGMISNDDKYRINTPMMSAFSILSLSRVNSTTATFALAFILGLSLTLLSIVGYNSGFSIISSVYARPAVSPDGPTLNDPNLFVETVYQGLKSPTSMAFLGPDDILVLEKGQGTVQRIINGEILPEPLLQVDVTSKDERGLLGIAIASPQEEDDEENREQEESATLATTTTT